MNTTMKLTQAMVYLLRFAKTQAASAAEWPETYSSDLWIGTCGVHKATAQALISRGLVDRGERHGFVTITINQAGLDALAREAA